jgi:hypothetical protein
MIGRKNTGFYNRECHIIGIGIDNYKSKDWKKLNNCESDVKRFINKVCTSFETFSLDFVTELYNEQATKEVIEFTIKTKINIMRSHQNLIIYFAGHGTHIDKLGYLAPQDAKSSYENPQKSKLISHTEIFNWIDNKSPWHIVIILDCCHGGRIMNAKRESVEKYTFDEYVNDNLGNPDYEEIKKIKSAWVITSGSNAQTVDDGDENGSPFSQSLMKLLNGAIETKSEIPVTRLGAILKHHSPKKYKQRPDYKHLNDIKGYKQTGGEFVFEPLSRRLKQEPVIESVAKPVIESVVKPVVESVVKPIVESVAKPVIESVIKPVVESVAKPVIESVIKPVVESVAKPVVESVAKSVVESAAKPLFRPLSNLSKIKKTLLAIFILGLIIIPMIILLLRSTDDNESLLPAPQPSLPVVDTPSPLPPTHGLDVINVDTSKPRPNKNPSPIKRKVYFDEDKDNSDNVNIVFVGSFQIKGNAEALLEKLKKIGYQKAEIVMKENLPYAVVVTGFHQSNIAAKTEVKKLKKNGIEVYYSESNYYKIYRK